MPLPSTINKNTQKDNLSEDFATLGLQDDIQIRRALTDPRIFETVPAVYLFSVRGDLTSGILIILCPRKATSRSRFVIALRTYRIPLENRTDKKRIEDSTTFLVYAHSTFSLMTPHCQYPTCGRYGSCVLNHFVCCSPQN